MTPLPEAIAPAKRQFVPSISDGKGKIIKLHEFNDNTIIPLEVIDKMDVTEFIVSQQQDPECIFDAIIRDPFDLSEYFHNGKVNYLTIPMRQKIAHSIGLYEIPILPIRETRGALINYYASLQSQLIYFDQNVSVYHVQPDGNCLYRSLSHIIFGTENCFEILKYNLIIHSTQHHYNVMHRSGKLSEQELHEHIDLISPLNEWGTNVELNMLAALARIDILLLDCTDVNSMNWNILPNYIHNQLDIPIECDPIFNAHRVCILLVDLAVSNETNILIPYFLLSNVSSQ